MSLPKVAGHELQKLIGSGSCGDVFRATTSSGIACAVKVFSSMAINRRALAAVTRAVRNLPAHRGVLPILAYDFDSSPYYSATPLAGAAGQDATGKRIWVTPTLESLCGKIHADQAWRYIYEVAESMAWLHRHGITHGNLRPVNVLLEDDPESATRLADIGQGWVGGTHHFEVTDHFMHLCPDHADDPEGLTSPRGFSWDVYSFGVLAYRLLTGQFPRAEKTWHEQVAAARAKVANGLPFQIENAAVLEAVRAQTDIEWPGPPGSLWDQRRREIIEQSLRLNAAERWTDMREVVREFEMLEYDYLIEDARERIVLEKSRQNRRVRQLNIIAASLLASMSIATILFVLTFLRAHKAETNLARTRSGFAAEMQGRDGRIAALTAERDKAQQDRTRIDANLYLAQTAADRFLTQLLQNSTAGSSNEAQFSRKQLEDALTYLQRQLATLEQSPHLALERARAYGNLGRIYLYLHKDSEASRYLEKSRAESTKLLAGGGESSGGVYRQWLGRSCLLLADIRTREGRSRDAMLLLRDATSHLQAGLQADPANRFARLECARAWHDYGSRLRVTGALPEAADACARVPLILDAALIGSELLPDERFLIARSQFERAMAQKDSGKIEDSVSTLIDAVQVMGEIVAKSAPANQDQALALAEAYTELAEIVGQHFSRTDAREAHQQALPILLELNRLHPDWTEVKFLLARNYGSLSAIERDAGRNSDALKKKQDAIELMNEILADEPENARYAFQLARLKGEYAELIADLGKPKDAVPIVKQAVQSLEGLLGTQEAPAGGHMSRERKSWEVQLAQLYGVLGHTSESADQKDLARTSFTTAAQHWEKLAADDTSDEAAKQGLNWTRDRLKKLK